LSFMGIILVAFDVLVNSKIDFILKLIHLYLKFDFHNHAL